MRTWTLMTVVLLFSSSIAIAQTETMKLTTYYPSPFGAYDVIRLIPRSGAPGTCADGTLYVDSSDSELHICGGGSGPGSNDSISVWEQVGTNIFPRKGTGQNVGIGTESPGGKLEVAGGTAIFEDIDASGGASIGGSANISGSANVDGGATVNGKLQVNNDTQTNKLFLKADGSNVGELKVTYSGGAYYATYAP